MTESDERTTGTKTVQVSQDELDELRQLKIVQEAKSELINWAKQWATLASIIIAIVGLIGLNVLVATVVRGFVADEIKEAQKTAIIATESLGKARIEMEKATKAAAEYADQVDKMRTKADEVDRSFLKLGAKLEGKERSVREEARLLTRDLEHRLEVQEKTLAKLIAESSSDTKATKFLKNAEKVEEDATARRAAFQSNSEYTAQITFKEHANSNVLPIASALEEIGFQTVITGDTDALFAEGITGVKKGTFSETTKVVVVHDPGEEKKAGLIAKTIESRLGKESVGIVKGPPSDDPRWMVVFIPNKK